jgi:hypothetical protein
MNHMTTPEPSEYKLPKHLIDKEEFHFNDEPEPKDEDYLKLEKEILSMTEITLDRVERYLQNYNEAGTHSESDCDELIDLFDYKLKQLREMKATVEFLTVEDCTVRFKDRIFELKMMFGNCNINCMKHITHLTNMYVYDNIVMYNGHLISFKTQTGEVINQFTITNLN